VLRRMRLWGDYAVGMVKDCNWLQHRCGDPKRRYRHGGSKISGSTVLAQNAVVEELADAAVAARRGHRFVRHALRCHE
jgi:hypothetical protein